MRRSGSNLSCLMLFITVLVIGLVSFYGQRAWQPVPPVNTAANTFYGQVVSVTDGDTIRVTYGGSVQRIRLWGIDCPERTQDYGRAARRFTISMVYHKRVLIDVRDTDRYGRTVAWVTAPDGRVLNVALVKAGLAWWYQYYAPDDKELANAENQARTAKRGLWKEKNPVPPWEYRREKRQRRY